MPATDFAGVSKFDPVSSEVKISECNFTSVKICEICGKNCVFLG